MSLENFLKVFDIKKKIIDLQNKRNYIYNSIKEDFGEKFKNLFPHFHFIYNGWGTAVLLAIEQKNPLIEEDGGKFFHFIECRVENDNICFHSAILKIDPKETSFSINDPDREIGKIIEQQSEDNMSLENFLKAFDFKKKIIDLQNKQNYIYNSIKEDFEEKCKNLFPHFHFIYASWGTALILAINQKKPLIEEVNAKFCRFIECRVENDNICFFSAYLDIDPNETSFSINDPDRENKFMNIIKKYHDLYEEETKNLMRQYNTI